MNAAELVAFVGKTGLMSFGGSIGVMVRSLNAREVYGRLDVLVEPISGTGHAWVAESRIAWEDKP